MPENFLISPTTNLPLAVAEKIFDILRPEPGSNDFGNSVVISPTKNSARAIMRHFASISESRSGCGTSGLEFITPQIFLEKAAVFETAANPFECLGAFKHAIEAVNESDFPNLFPNGKGSVNALSFARVLRTLRSLAAESGKTFADIARITSHNKISDSGRWAEMAKIEELYLDLIAQTGKSDPSDLMVKSAQKPGEFLPNRIILAGVLDIPQIFCELLENLESRASQINVITISEINGAFDKWGRPAPIWTDVSIGIADSAITVCSDTRMQAEILSREISKHKPQDCAIACDEGQSMNLIFAELAAEGIKTFSPEGDRLSEGDAFAFVKLLKNHYDGADENASFTLMRSPLFAGFVSKKSGVEKNDVRMICDEFKSQKLCPDIRRALNAAQKGTLEHRVFLEADAILNSEGEKTSQTLARIFAKVLNGANAVSGSFETACVALADGIQRLRAAENADFEFNVSEAIQILLECCDARLCREATHENEIPLLNWLEFFWTPHNNMFVADFNEGKVPERIFGDAFMPDSLRTELGIRNSSFRHSRDAAMFHAIFSARKREGSLKIFVPKTDIDGEPLKPSRLLLQDPPELLTRVKLLFKESPTEKRASAFAKSWNLKIARTPVPEYLSVTDFKAYIECPLRFYLERILKARAFMPDKAELDAMQIGSCVHDAFNECAKTQSKDAEEIAEILKRGFKKSLRKNFGRELQPAVLLQSESIFARLEAAAIVEAEHRLKGWKTIYSEEVFPILEIGGFKIKSRLDRVDVNPEGEYLVVDYKTSDRFDARKGCSPAETAHTMPSKSGEPVRWLDLQLPLYRKAAMEKLGSHRVLCAYFTLPAKTECTSLLAWDIDDEMQASAIRKAEEIAAQIRSGNFEPSEKTPLVKYYPQFFGWTDPEHLKDFVEVEK